MTLRRCVERAERTRAAWCSELDLDAAEFDGLVSARVLRAQPIGGLFRLEFVGLIMTERGSIAVTPRVSGGENYSFAALLSLMRRYFLRSAARRPYETEAEAVHFQDQGILRSFDAYLALMAWRREHGLYRHEARALTKGFGRPDWRRTFGRTPGLISGDQVLYDRPISARRVHNPSLMGSLQLYFLDTLSDRFGYAPPPDLTTDRLWTLPLGADPREATGRAFLADRVRAERRTVFRSDRLALLDVLLGLLDAPAPARGNGVVSLYGTTAFYGVWEDACRNYFSSDENSVLTELAQPRWYLRSADGTWRSAAGGKQQPDIALRAEGVRAILDAKYYHPFPYSSPGWADIVKQLYYRDCLAKEPGEVVNAFLMPGQAGVRFAFAGYVAVEGVGRTYPPIEAWLLDPCHVLDAYLLSDPRHLSALEGFLSTRDAMREDLVQSPTQIEG